MPTKKVARTEDSTDADAEKLLALYRDPGCADPGEAFRLYLVEALLTDLRAQANDPRSMYVRRALSGFAALLQRVREDASSKADRDLLHLLVEGAPTEDPLIAGMPRQEKRGKPKHILGFTYEPQTGKPVSIPFDRIIEVDWFPAAWYLRDRMAEVIEQLRETPEQRAPTTGHSASDAAVKLCGDSRVSLGAPPDKDVPAATWFRAEAATLARAFDLIFATCFVRVQLTAPRARRIEGWAQAIRAELLRRHANSLRDSRDASKAVVGACLSELGYPRPSDAWDAERKK